MSSRLALSADLRRVAYCLMNGEAKTAQVFLDRDLARYGGEAELRKWLARVTEQKEAVKLAEAALTVSVILAGEV